jgi:hypothetical protein
MATLEVRDIKAPHIHPVPCKDSAICCSHPSTFLVRPLSLGRFIKSVELHLTHPPRLLQAALSRTATNAPLQSCSPHHFSAALHRKITPLADPTVVDFASDVNGYHAGGRCCATSGVIVTAASLFIADSQRLSSCLVGYDGTDAGWL